MQARRVLELVQLHVRKGITPAMLAHDGHLLEAGTGLDVVAEVIADAHALAGAVVDAPGQIGVNLFSVIGVDGRQSGAGGLLRAFEAVFADFARDVHEGFAREVAMLFDGLPLGAQHGAVMGDAALLVGDDDLDAIAEDGFLERSVIARALGRR